MGRGIITFSLLAQGLLADRYLEGVPSDSRMAHDPRCLRRSSLTSDVHDKIVRLNDIAAGRGQALAEMALAWQLRDPDVTSVLIGASRPEQVLDNIRALDSCAFSDGELAAIDEASGFAR
ncbi:aldo/keto reductase [Parolsenella catena]|uniref:aldo/keto reductase n=1 Tax=Parolsenella catena TaxID=2003188 RepID=UPI003AEFAA64